MTVANLENITVSKLLVHPIKSCRGTSMAEVDFTPQGVKYDRNWSIIDATKNTILTLRDVPKLALIHPTIKVDKDMPSEGTMTVTFPKDSGIDSFDVPLQPDQTILRGCQKVESMRFFTKEWEGYIFAAAPTPPSSFLSSFLFQSPVPTQTPSSLLSAFLQRPVHLVFKSPKARPCDPTETHPDLLAHVAQHDKYPILVLGEESVGWLEQETRKYVGQQGVEERWREERLRIERFRPNVVVAGADPFAEDSWTEIAIEPEFDHPKKNPSIALVSKCTRCLLPNVDPETGIRDKAVPYKIMMKSRTGLAPESMRSPCMGVNGVPSGSGKIRVGDRVRILGRTRKGD